MKTSVWDYSHNVVPPLSSNSTFRLDSSERGSMGFEEYANNKNNEPIYIYDRLEEPTTMMLEQRLAEAEEEIKPLHLQAEWLQYQQRYLL